MARAYLNSTTLDSALDDKQTILTVGSNSNMDKGDHIVIDDEILLVTDDAVGGTTTSIQVIRGVMGTLQRSHAVSRRIWIGQSPGEEPAFRVLADGSVVMSGDPGGSLPFYRRPGQRARDGAGNEYVMVDLTATTYSRQPLQINADFTAAPVGTTGRGAFGVSAEEGTSDQWAWAQIFGRCFVQLGMSGVSPSDAANGPTTLSTSAGTVFILATSQTTPVGIGWVSDPSSGGVYRIEGMWVASDASPGDVSAVTSAASHTGAQIAVFLNYPEIKYWNDQPS